MSQGERTHSSPTKSLIKSIKTSHEDEQHLCHVHLCFSSNTCHMCCSFKRYSSFNFFDSFKQDFDFYRQPSAAETPDFLSLFFFDLSRWLTVKKKPSSEESALTQTTLDALWLALQCLFSWLLWCTSQSRNTGLLSTCYTLEVCPKKNRRSVARMSLLAKECGVGDSIQCQRAREGENGKRQV